MAIDMNRLAAAALDAALDDGQPPPKRRLSTFQAVAAGALIATAARAAIRRTDLLPRPPREFTDALRNRLADLGLSDEEIGAQPEGEFEDPEADDDYEDEGDEENKDEEDEDEYDDESEDEYDDEPAAEATEDEPEDEYDDEPAAEATEDEPEDEYDDEPAAEATEDEPEDAGDEDEASDRPDRGSARVSTPDLLEALSHIRQPPLVLGRRGRRLDPAARPPEPPDQEDEEQTKAGRG
jgi:hypothetical protein